MYMYIHIYIHTYIDIYIYIDKILQTLGVLYVIK